jgi:spore coat protein U-like protein
VSPAALACTVTVAQLAFGSYDPRSPAPQDSSAVVRWDCAAPARVALGGAPDRQLRGPRGSLHYGLYLDGRRRQPWGDGSGGTSMLSLPAGRSTVTIFARIHPPATGVAQTLSNLPNGVRTRILTIPDRSTT